MKYPFDFVIFQLLIAVADDVKTSLVFKILLVMYDNVLQVKLMTYGSKNITEGNVLYVEKIDEKKTRYMSVFLFFFLTNYTLPYGPVTYGFHGIIFSTLCMQSTIITQKK